MKCNILSTLCGIVMLFQAYGQANISNEILLRVGDRVPDVKLSHIINFPSKEARISDFKDKLLILDFWTTVCEPCVRAFPKLDSLQREFEGQIQIMPVTWEEAPPVERLFSRIKKQRDFILPTAVDTVLYKYFSDSANRWSGSYAFIKKGKIVALTSGTALTAESIRTVLSGGSLSVGRKRAFGKLLPRDFSKPLLLGGEYSDKTSRVMYYSAIMPYIQGLDANSSSGWASPDDETAGIRIVNLPLSFLYTYAYQLGSFATDILIETEDPSKFRASKEDTTQLYCYELIMPNADSETLHDAMKDDLRKTFGYIVTREKRYINCAVLKKRGKNDLLSTRGGTPFSEKSIFYITLINRPFSVLVSSLDYYLPKDDFRYVIDETGVVGNIDINIDAFLRDTEAVAEQLKRYGLDLVVEKRPVDMWVVRDDGPGNHP